MATQTEPEIVASTELEKVPAGPRRRRSLMLPEAYDERVMPSLQLARSSRRARRIARALALGLFGGFLTIALAPWQQSVRGMGQVIAYSPGERMQTIEAPTKGRIVEWGDDIFENAHVQEGQVIARIQDLDESYLDRLEAGVAAGVSQVEALQNQIDASQRNLTAAQSLVQTLTTQVLTYRSVKEQITASADAAIESTRGKLDSERRKLEEVEATLAQAKPDYERQKTLFEERIVAEVKFQSAEQKYKEAVAKVRQAESNIEAADAQLDEKMRDRDAKERKAQADVEYAQSTLDKATGDVAKIESEIAKANSDLEKAKQELLKAQNSLARQSQQTIEAPFDGFLTRILPNQGSAVLKEGDPICVIVPDTADRSVEIFLSGNDAPLVETGRHVRLQFEGWPAVQFAGWPSVAVGTFGGTIVSVDATDDGMGKFRVIVRPDPTEVHPWPSERYLRQGVRANGWVLLEVVPMWYEIWRNMNGFPPSISADEKSDKSGGPKVPKLPKV